MTLILSIIIGLIIGAIAKFIMPGPTPGGIIATTLIGMGGSVIATGLGQFLNIYQSGQHAGFLFSIVGSIILLFIYQLIAGHRKSG